MMQTQARHGMASLGVGPESGLRRVGSGFLGRRTRAGVSGRPLVSAPRARHFGLAASPTRGVDSGKATSSARVHSSPRRNFVGRLRGGKSGRARRAGLSLRNIGLRACAVSEEEEVRELGWPRTFHEKYELKDDVLGEGSFGVVMRAIERDTDTEVAVKVLPKHRRGEWERYSALLKNEVACWEAVEWSPYVVKLYGYYEDDNSLYIVQEMCTGGDLQHYLKRNKKLSEDDAAKVITAILGMLSACHDSNVCFGDVKPANFMLESEYPCKRHLVDSTAPKGELSIRGIDFGCSQKVQDEVKLKKRTGTPLYMAPEIFFGWYGLEVDIWAAGMLLYQLLSNKLPFFGERVEELGKGPPFMVVQAVMDSNLEFEGEPWDGISDSAKDLISKLLDIDYHERISAKDALQHPWILEHLPSNEFVGDLQNASSNILKFPGSTGTPVVGQGTDDCKGGKGGAV